jgi:hypothetical protein
MNCTDAVRPRAGGKALTGVTGWMALQSVRLRSIERSIRSIA